MPKRGGRIRLELVETDGARATYTVALLLEDETFETQATTGPEVVVGELDGAPEWLVAHVRPLLRQAASRAKDGRWPRRLMRWRAPR